MLSVKALHSVATNRRMSNVSKVNKSQTTTQNQTWTRDLLVQDQDQGFDVKGKTNTKIPELFSRSRLHSRKKVILMHNPFMLNTSYHTQMTKYRVLKTI